MRRCRDAQFRLVLHRAYNEFIVDDIDEAIPRQPTGRLRFLAGWNYTTDLYRVLRDMLGCPAGHVTSPLVGVMYLNLRNSKRRTILETSSRIDSTFRLLISSLCCNFFAWLCSEANSKRQAGKNAVRLPENFWTRYPRYRRHTCVLSAPL